MYPVIVTLVILAAAVALFVWNRLPVGVVAIGVAIGGLVGLIAGTAGGWVDTVLMRITDAFLSIRAPVLAIDVVGALGPGFLHTLFAVSATPTEQSVPPAAPSLRVTGVFAALSSTTN